MPKYRARIRGVNFHMRIDSEDIAPFGFYVLAFFEAESPATAEFVAVDLVRSSPKLRETVFNPVDDAPRLFVEEIEHLADWPSDCAFPLTGFGFYPESEENSPSAAKPAAT